jgi:3-oxocholest-4-en-26-oate---CoA ligase
VGDATIPSNLWTLFDFVARQVPDRESLIWREQRLTFEELRDRSAHLAGFLASRGLGTRVGRERLQPWESGQDAVGLLLLNGPAYLTATLGGLAARTAPFNLNHRYTATELHHVLDDADATALVYHERFAPVVAEVLPRLARRPELV